MDIGPEEERRLQAELFLAAKKLESDKLLANESAKRETKRFMASSVVLLLVTIVGAYAAAHFTNSDVHSIAEEMKTLVNLRPPKVSNVEIPPPPHPGPTPTQIKSDSSSSTSDKNVEETIGKKPTSENTVSDPPPIQSSAIFSDPRILDSCSISSPFHVVRIRVDRIPNGYTVATKLKNGGTADASLYAGNPIHLNDDAQSDFENGSPNIPPGDYKLRGTLRQPVGALFEGGHSFPANETSDLNIQFVQRGHTNAGSVVTFGINFYYFLRSSDGAYSAMRQTSLSCQSVPVLSSSR